MSKRRAAILGPWEQDAEGVNVPAIESVWLAAGAPWENLHDVTGQPGTEIPTNPNLAVWQVDAVEDAALDLLEDDGRFVVLWSEDI
jgi:hypothetical protein